MRSTFRMLAKMIHRFSGTVGLPSWRVLSAAAWCCACSLTGEVVPEPAQRLERTSFQTGQSYRETINLPADVVMVYGIDAGLPDRIKSWRDQGYRIHVMTGVSWGHYQDYLYGRFDGINHEDEAQTERNGRKISHGGDVYYMCPGANFGKFLCQGVQRALDAGAEAIHLEEPEFWVRAGYSEGFKREWKSYYQEDWTPPHSSPDAQWRASKLKYYLYRRALQQVFDYIQAYNREHQRQVRCYVPTHSLINYAHWRIVSPESSLAMLNGCDGYIAQVWTGTARTRNLYRGVLKERTFETAFLEYGVMQNLVRSTGRQVWYLADPVEDDPNHDWGDYRTNYQATLAASLLQPEVWRYEVMPWPERIFHGKYPSVEDPKNRIPIPPPYATELQVVIHALNALHSTTATWENGLNEVGVAVSDSLMFQRGEPHSSDPHLSHFYGMALPLLKRGVAVQPIQLENVVLPDYLKGIRILLLSYQGMKPLAPEVHASLADWVRQGGVLLFVDDDSDPYNQVREWWNTGNHRFATPRQHLFEQLARAGLQETGAHSIGKGWLIWQRLNPVELAKSQQGDQRLMAWVEDAFQKSGIAWTESHCLVLRRGPFVVAAGLDESVSGKVKTLPGRFIDLFDPHLPVLTNLMVKPGARHFLRELPTMPHAKPVVLAAACQIVPENEKSAWTVTGIANTPATVLIQTARPAKQVTLQGQPLKDFEYHAESNLLRVQFQNEARKRLLELNFE